MKTICKRIKLKPNSITKVWEWSKELNARKAEVLETLRNETVVFEAAFLDEVSETEAYLIYMMQIEDQEQCRKAADESVLPIDAYHRKFTRETWEWAKELETLIAFNA